MITYSLHEPSKHRQDRHIFGCKKACVSRSRFSSMTPAFIYLATRARKLPRTYETEATGKKSRATCCIALLGLSITAGCSTNGPMLAPFSPHCHVLCTETRLNAPGPGQQGLTAGPFRIGQAEADTWSKWDPPSMSAPLIKGGADVDQVWIRNRDEPGKHDVFRVDVVSVSGDLLYTHQKFDGTWTLASPINGHFLT
jgi:hypothetical protein